MWTGDGAHLVLAGHDERVRVWDAATGANTLAAFGPGIRNGQLASANMFTTPAGLGPPGGELLFWPNGAEILVMGLHEGTTVTRLRGLGAGVAGVKAPRGGERSARNRVTGLVWRGWGGSGGSRGDVPGGSNAPGGVYIGHTDTQQEKTQKRKAIDDAYRSLMGQNITFT